MAASGGPARDQESRPPERPGAPPCAPALPYRFGRGARAEGRYLHGWRGSYTTALSEGQRTRQPSLISFSAPAAASKRHASTPRRSRGSFSVGAVVTGSSSTCTSAISLTGIWSSTTMASGVAWPLRTVILYSRSSVLADE